MVWNRRTPISCVFLLVEAVLVSGEQPNDNTRFLLPGEVAWTVALPVSAAAPGALDEAHLYVPLEDGRVLALDRETGATRWTRVTDTPATPLSVGGTLFVPTAAGLEALDAATGRPRWTARVPGGPVAPLVALDGAVAGMSALGVVAAVGGARGEILWRRDLGPSSIHVLAAADGRLYATLDDGRLVALAADDGRVLWERRLPGVLGAPGAAAGYVLVGSSDNALFAFDGRGSLVWRWRTGGDVIGAAIGPDRAYFTALDNRLRAVDRGSGNQRWQIPLPTRPARPPELVGGVVVVTGVATDVRAFDAVTGALVGAYVAPADLRGPALVDPRPKPYEVALAVVTRDGRAIGLRPSGLQLPEPTLTPLEALPGRTVPFP